MIIKKQFKQPMRNLFPKEHKNYHYFILVSLSTRESLFEVEHRFIARHLDYIETQ